MSFKYKENKMLNEFSREELLIGKEALEKLEKSKVAVFGIGGVGSFVVEGLTRAGIGNLVLIDEDTISITNINRQLHATHNTIGKFKIEVMKDRVLSINANANVEIYKPSNVKDREENIIDSSFDYVVDAVDTIQTKIKLIEKAKKTGVPVISCMGTGNKLDPSKFEIADISKTTVCPLAKIIRKELKNRNIKDVKVLYSKEIPIKPKYEKDDEKAPASISFMPSVAGLMIAGEVIKDIIK